MVVPGTRYKPVHEDAMQNGGSQRCRLDGFTQREWSHEQQRMEKKRSVGRLWRSRRWSKDWILRDGGALAVKEQSPAMVGEFARV